MDKPYIFLRCKKCGRKTDHVLINTSFLFRFGEAQMEETYECQECEETRKIYEFTTPHGFIPKEMKEKEKKKRKLI